LLTELYCYRLVSRLSTLFTDVMLAFLCLSTLWIMLIETYDVITL